jgi:hypothetical protein
MASALLALALASARCGGDAASCSFEHAGTCYGACASALDCASRLPAQAQRTACGSLSYYEGPSSSCHLVASPKVCITDAEAKAVPVNPGSCYQ